MMATSNVSHWAQDLAGAWTESALEILGAAGVQVSVPMELETWRIMSQILQFEIRERGFQLRTFVSAESLKEQVILQTTLLARRKFDLPTGVSEWSGRIHNWNSLHELTSSERGLFWQAYQAKKPARLTDYVAKLSSAASGA